ncbi:MAG: sugar-binding transcriptional regulator [Firmicutes bacterium]|jgi:DNA-binding transcriptional regulator LsrR (DeoR family)|nr:sugar-binding transcriptional regulator [Bacillota bacterium]
MGFDRRLLHQVANQYYELDKTQEEIAQALGISRSQVSRAIKQARAEGIVVIRVVPPGLDFSDLRAELCERFGLRDAVVISGEGGPSHLVTQNLGKAGAEYLAERAKPGLVVGVSWGATLRELASALSTARPRARDLLTVPLLGGLGQASVELQVNDIASRIAKALGGSHLYLHAPSFVDTPEAHAAITSDSNIKRVVDMWDRLDIAVVGIGCLKPPSTLLQEGGFSDEDLGRLETAGTVGDMCMRFFDIEGKPVDTYLDGRIVGVGLDQLRKARMVVGVAGGENKTDAILGALHTGVLDVLITDDVAARSVIRLSKQTEL